MFFLILSLETPAWLFLGLVFLRSGWSLGLTQLSSDQRCIVIKGQLAKLSARASLGRLLGAQIRLLTLCETKSPVRLVELQVSPRL